MFEIQSKLLIAIMIVNAFISNLGAIQLKTEFYPAKDTPKEYDQYSDGGDFTIISIEGWPLNSTVSVIETRSILSRQTKDLGTMKSSKGAFPKRFVSSKGYTPGVPITWTFKDTKKRLQEKITFIPNRLYVKSSIDNAQIEAKLFSDKPPIYNICLEGFCEGEELILKSSSYDEMMENKIPFNKDLALTITPAVINKQGGIARLSFTRPSGEDLKLELPWGLEWIKYLTFSDKDGTMKFILDTPDYRKENQNVVEYFNSNR